MDEARGDSAPRLFRTYSGLLLAIIASIALFAWLGAGSLENGDSAVYAWAARRMVQDGSWLDYRWHDAPLFEYYPPLHFVLVRLSVTLLGATELAFRLPAAMAGLVSVLLTGAITTRVSRSSLAGLLAGLLLLASVTFYLAARSVRMDAVFLATAMAVYYCYLRSWTERRWLWALGLSAGLAYWAKSLMVAFVLAPIAVDVLWHDRGLLRDRRVYGAAILFLLFALAWHASLMLAGSNLVPNYGKRIVTGIAGDFTAIKVVREAAAAERWLLPVWCAALAALAWSARTDRAARLFVVAIAAGIAILLATRTSMTHYALPLYPPLAVGGGALLGRVFSRRPVYVPLAVCALVGAFAAGNLGMFVHPDLSPGVQEVAKRARDLGPRGPVLFYRDYSASFDFYLDRETLLVTESPRAFELYTAHGSMREGPGIELVTPQDLLVRLTTPGMICVTTLFSHDHLAAYLEAMAPAVRAELQRVDAGAYVLYHLPR